MIAGTIWEMSNGKTESVRAECDGFTSFCRVLCRKPNDHGSQAIVDAHIHLTTLCNGAIKSLMFIKSRAIVGPCR